jgi:hypothetical protein
MKFGSMFLSLVLGTFISVASAQETDAVKLAGAAYEQDAIGRYESYDVFSADDGETQVGVVFALPAPLKNFRILSITFRDANDDGIFFDEKEIYRVDELSAKKPLLVRMSFYGDIPSYGLSYEDKDGKVQKYAIGESGMDGSLELVPFK